MRRTIACLMAAMLFVCGCSKGEIPEQTTALPPVTTAAATTARTEPGDGLDGHALSTELYTDGEKAIFVDPANEYLTSFDLRSGSKNVLCYEKVYPSFIAVAGRVFFRSISTGQICAVDMDGRKFKAYFNMPFSEGVYIDGRLWFAAENTSSGEYLLYSYDPAKSEWSSIMLTDSNVTQTRRTIAYTSEAVFYIVRNSGRDVVMRLDLITGERSEVYDASKWGAAIIPELFYCDDGVCFADRGEGRLYVVNEAGECELYSEATVGRVVSALSDGMLYVNGDGWHDTVTMGNAEGVETECFGGVFLARYGNRALVHRAEGVCVVKYPEDEAVRIGGHPICVRVGSESALVVTENDEQYHLVSLRTGEVTPIKGVEMKRRIVSPEEYIAAPEGRLPSASALASAGPAVRVSVYATAALRGDAEVLDMLLEGGERVPPYNGFSAEAFEISCTLLTASEAEYEIYYSFAADGDSIYTNFVPMRAAMTSVRLELISGYWKFVWPELLSVTNAQE